METIWLIDRDEDWSRALADGLERRMPGLQCRRSSGWPDKLPDGSLVLGGAAGPGPAACRRIELRDEPIETDLWGGQQDLPFCTCLRQPVDLIARYDDPEQVSSIVEDGVRLWRYAPFSLYTAVIRALLGGRSDAQAGAFGCKVIFTTSSDRDAQLLVRQIRQAASATGELLVTLPLAPLYLLSKASLPAASPSGADGRQSSFSELLLLLEHGQPEPGVVWNYLEPAGSGGLCFSPLAHASDLDRVSPRSLKRLTELLKQAAEEQPGGRRVVFLPLLSAVSPALLEAFTPFADDLYLITDNEPDRLQALRDNLSSAIAGLRPDCSCHECLLPAGGCDG